MHLSPHESEVIASTAELKRADETELCQKCQFVFHPKQLGFNDLMGCGSERITTIKDDLPEVLGQPQREDELA